MYVIKDLQVMLVIMKSLSLSSQLKNHLGQYHIKKEYL